MPRISPALQSLTKPEIGFAVTIVFLNCLTELNRCVVVLPWLANSTPRRTYDSFAPKGLQPHARSESNAETAANNFRPGETCT